MLDKTAIRVYNNYKPRKRKIRCAMRKAEVLSRHPCFSLLHLPFVVAVRLPRVYCRCGFYLPNHLLMYLIKLLIQLPITLAATDNKKSIQESIRELLQGTGTCMLLINKGIELPKQAQELYDMYIRE